MSPTVAWQLSWGVGASFCVLAGLWFLVLTVPEEGRPFAWVLALAFCVHCVAAAANLRRLLWDAFVGPGRISYLSVLLETGLWALISAGLAAACARAGAAGAARAWAVAFVAFSVLSAYCFWRVS